MFRSPQTSLRPSAPSARILDFFTGLLPACCNPASTAGGSGWPQTCAMSRTWLKMAAVLQTAYTVAVIMLKKLKVSEKRVAEALRNPLQSVPQEARREACRSPVDQGPSRQCSQELRSMSLMVDYAQGGNGCTQRRRELGAPQARVR